MKLPELPWTAPPPALHRPGETLLLPGFKPRYYTFVQSCYTVVKIQGCNHGKLNHGTQKYHRFWFWLKIKAGAQLHGLGPCHDLCSKGDPGN